MDVSVQKKMDGTAWLIVLWIVGAIGGDVYVGNVETSNEWIIGLFLLPALVMGVICSGFFLLALCVLVYWMWGKLTQFVLFLSRLYPKKDGLV